MQIVKAALIGSATLAVIASPIVAAYILIEHETNMLIRSEADELLQDIYEYLFNEESP